MFNIKVLVPGVFCLDLEEGATNIRHDQIVNLDLYCSREWINTNPNLRSLIKRKIIMVLFDSANDQVPKVNLKSVSKKTTAPVVVPPKSVAVRQSQLVPAVPSTVKVTLPEPVSDSVPVVIDLATNAITQPRTEVKLEPSKLTVEDTGKRYTEPELRKMYLNDLKLLAAGLNINIVPPISKIRLVQSILKKYNEDVGKLAVNM